MCIPGRGTESITSLPHPQGLGAEGIPGVISKGRLTAVRPASRLTHLRPSPFQAGPACSRVGGTHRRLPVRLGSPSPRKQSPQLPGAGPQQCPVPTPSSPQLSYPRERTVPGVSAPRPPILPHIPVPQLDAEAQESRGGARHFRRWGPTGSVGWKLRSGCESQPCP